MFVGLGVRSIPTYLSSLHLRFSHILMVTTPVMMSTSRILLKNISSSAVTYSPPLDGISLMESKGYSSARAWVSVGLESASR